MCSLAIQYNVVCVELTFKLVMCRCGGERVAPAAPDTAELHSLRASLAQERARSRQLKALIERKVLDQQKRCVH